MTFLDYAGLSAALAVRVRSTSAAIAMEGSALLRAMSAIDDVEQGWQGQLARAARDPQAGQLYELLEEMLGTDVLLRTWASCVASSVDAGKRALRPQSAAALLTRMLLQQRKRLLLAVLNANLDLESMQQLDKHRRVCERWNDVLLSVFPATSTTRALKFDYERSRDFLELWPSPAVCSTRSADPVVVTAMKSALPSLPLDGSPRKTAWLQLADAITAAMQHDRRVLTSTMQPQA